MIWTLAILLAIYAVPFFMSAMIHLMSPEKKLESGPSDPAFTTKVKVVTTFMVGLGDGVLGYDPAKRKGYIALTTFAKPFYVEGACAGLQLAQYIAPWRARRNLAKFRQQHQRFIFLLTIGSGFSHGLRNFWKRFSSPPGWIAPVDSKLQSLFFDGYAFEKSLFGYRKNPSMLNQGLSLDPAAHAGFYEGTGRAFWFLLPSFNAFRSAIAELPGDCMEYAHVGYGIACGFAGCELVAGGALAAYPPEILGSPHFHSGLITGLFARYYTEPEYLENLLAGPYPELLEDVRHSAASFEKLWQQGLTYEHWRQTIQLELQENHRPDIYLHRAAASLAGK